VAERVQHLGRGGDIDIDRGQVAPQLIDQAHRQQDEHRQQQREFDHGAAATAKGKSGVRPDVNGRMPSYLLLSRSGGEAP
jgi:hypothetical protein